MERDERYTQAVYNLCERAQARHALEVGLGRMQSGQAIVRSLSNRTPAMLHSIDIGSDGLTPDMFNWADSLGVHWMFTQGDACSKSINGSDSYDFAHIDGVGDNPDHLNAMYRNLSPLMKSGAIFAIAGAGPEYPSIMETCNAIGGFHLEMFGERSGHAIKTF